MKADRSIRINAYMLRVDAVSLNGLDQSKFTADTTS